MPFNTFNKSWFIRYKFYHIPFWFVYHYIWWVVAVGNPVKAFHAIFFTPFFIKYFFYLFFQAMAVYFNLYFLIPRFLEKGKLTAYIICLLITIVAASLLIVPGYYLMAYLSGKTVSQMLGNAENCFYQFIGISLPSTLATVTFAMSIKLTKNWLQSQRRHQALEKEKLETELNYLKYQFNPHFLFNTINSIFFLIHKNPDMASASLAKFSDLLRYQLYECNDSQIPLSKEITYLENSVELEKLRQNNNVEVSLEADQQGLGQLGIAPFILMTFVENAFKHVSKHADKPNWIRIRLRTDQRRLYFQVSNSTMHGASTDVLRYGGIGLKNVQRRLDLIYPGQYDLEIHSDSNSFEVKLILNLTELMMPQPMQQSA